jgi:hypothetical protein
MIDPEYICENHTLRALLPYTDEQLMVQLDRLGIRSYQYDIGPNNEIFLRLSYEFLKQLVEIQKSAPLESAPVLGTARGRRGHVLVG